MNVFELRNQVIEDYASYIRSFVEIRDARIRDLVERELSAGFLWPQPLVQLNPAFEPGETFDQLIAEGTLHPENRRIFARKDEAGNVIAPLRLHRHQVDGIRAARRGDSYILTTGTGSGKSLAYSQVGELTKFLCRGYPSGQPKVVLAAYDLRVTEKQKEGK